MEAGRHLAGEPAVGVETRHRCADVTDAHDACDVLRHHRDLREVSEEWILEVDRRLRAVAANQWPHAMPAVPPSRRIGRQATRLLAGDAEQHA